MEWKVNRSRIVFRDRWVSLRADDCITSSGVEIAPFYVLEYPDWVHVIAVDADNHVLLVRQYRHGYGGVTLELPGGVMDATDADPVTTAARELSEETGYTASSYRLLASLSPNPGTHTNRVHVVLAQPAVFTKPPTPEPSENISVVSMPVREAQRMALNGELIHAQHVGMLLIGLNAANLLQVGCLPDTANSVEIT
ncbi:NUDIX hydrolase [Microvirga tunisiensis]|uniref:NUDIX hydrolase n=1 Tax=Microvirga tunisiensis TaxID=2108360 RepID=A0A5N7ML86_9HYPH|nr:NUDIX hydrolase [Microvirga tunisiensis]MPR08709.1 NUDIX hydrolase [Microvirga tunisiensis]MPR26914.1 NUDIX hydrolase [Microvirga tunisiensis]